MLTEEKDNIDIFARFNKIMKDENFSWNKLSESTDKIDRGSLRQKIFRLLTLIDKYTSFLGYEVIFKKKNKK